MKGRKLRVLVGVTSTGYAYHRGEYEVPAEIKPEIAEDLLKAGHAEWVDEIERATISGETPEKSGKKKVGG